MTEEIITDKEDKTKKHRNNEIDCLHFSCRKGESGKVLLWCGFYDDHCDNYTGCYYRKYLRLEQENKELKELNKIICEDWEKEIKVYWNALEEIREIAVKYKDMEGCRIPLGAIKMTIDEVLNVKH